MYYFIFPVPRNKEKNSLKRSEIEVNIILKRKKHNSCSDWQIVSIKFRTMLINRYVFDLYEILIIKNSKEVHEIF